MRGKTGTPSRCFSIAERARVGAHASGFHARGSAELLYLQALILGDLTGTRSAAYLAFPTTVCRNAACTCRDPGCEKFLYEVCSEWIVRR